MITNKDKIFIDSLNEFKKSVYYQNKDTTTSFNSPNEVYELAVRQAYKDLQWRTVKSHSNNLKEHNIKLIARLIKKSVESNIPHIDLIKEVMVVFLNDFGATAKEQCFGKAQKVVNMSFKYLYCIGEINIDYTNRDMPLDDRIFDFYYTYRKNKNIKEENKIQYWSNISINDYQQIELNLKRYIKEIGLDMSPIEAEFIIWNYATAKLVINTYNSVKKSYDDLLKKEATIDCFNVINSLFEQK